ncbi:MAG: sulfite exporter TauE/SafE family protein [Patescibacteria group bacterium]
MDPMVLGAVALIGLIAGYINVIVGSGSSIAIPALIFLGLPPHIAIGTNRFAMIFNNGTGAIGYHRKGYLNVKAALLFSVFAAVGAAAGAFLAVKTQPALLVQLIALILVIEALVVLVGKNGLGIEQKIFELTQNNLIVGAVAGIVIGLYGGFIGMAITSMFMFIFVAFFSLSFLESAAMSKVVTFVISVVATVIFLASLKVDLIAGGVLATAYVVGAYAGVQSAVRMGNPWMRFLFVIVALASAGKLLFDLYK